MARCHSIGDRQPKSTAFDIKRCRAEETVKQARNIGLRDPAAGIQNLDRDRIPVLSYRNVNRSTGRRVANRIVNKVAKQHFQIGGPALNNDSVARSDAEIDPLCVGEGNKVCDALRDEFREVNCLSSRFAVRVLRTGQTE